MDDIDELDPAEVDGLNLYAYCGNDPIQNIDPDGNNWLRNLWRRFTNAISAVVNWVCRLAEGIWDGVKSTATWLWNTTKGLFTGETWVKMYHGAKNFFSNPWESTKSFFKGAWDFASGFVTSFFSSDPYFAGQAIGSMIVPIPVVGTAVGITKTARSISTMRKTQTTGAATKAGSVTSRTGNTAKLQSISLHPQSTALAKQGNPTFGTFRKRVWQYEATFNKQAYGTQISRMDKGKAPIMDGRSMQLHHVVGRQDLYHVVKLTHSQHIVFHKTFGYKQSAKWTLENLLSTLQ